MTQNYAKQNDFNRRADALIVSYKNGGFGQTKTWPALFKAVSALAQMEISENNRTPTYAWNSALHDLYSEAEVPEDREPPEFESVSNRNYYRAKNYLMGGGTNPADAASPPPQLTSPTVLGGGQAEGYVAGGEVRPKIDDRMRLLSEAPAAPGMPKVTLPPPDDTRNAAGLTPAEQAEIDKKQILPPQMRQTTVEEYLARFPKPEQFTTPESLTEFAKTTQDTELFRRDPNFSKAVLQRINEGGLNLAALGRRAAPGSQTPSPLTPPPQVTALEKAKKVGASLLDVAVAPQTQFERFLATDPFGKLNDEMSTIAQSREGAIFAPYLLGRVNQGELLPNKGGSFSDYLTGLGEEQFYGGAGDEIRRLLEQVKSKLTGNKSEFAGAGMETLNQYALPLIQSLFQENVPAILWRNMGDVIRQRANAYKFRNPTANLFQAFLDNNFSIPGV